MTWESFFLGCFVFGFVLSLIAFLAGSSHLHHGHVHLHGHGHGGGNGVSKFNFGTIAAFLTWFGGAGYILNTWGGIGLALVLVGASIGGVAGGALIFLFAAKVLAPNDRPLNPADYQMVGMLGTVSSTVLPGGTGEMIFVQQGRRAAVPIRSERGTLINAGRDVVVTRYESGIAYVRDFDELSA
jgi:hypothetical protein